LKGLDYQIFLGLSQTGNHLFFLDYLSSIDIISGIFSQLEEKKHPETKMKVVE